MKGIKTVVANLANRINQPHHLEIQLRKVFNAGFNKGKKEQFEWISIHEKLPDNDMQNVLVCIPHKDKVNVTTAIFHKAKKEGRRYGGYKMTFSPYWSLPCIVLLETVTFWASLPEPKSVS